MTQSKASGFHVRVLVLLPRRYHHRICLLPSSTLAILATQIQYGSQRFRTRSSIKSGGVSKHRYLSLEAFIVECCKGSICRGGQDPWIQPRTSPRSGMVEQFVVLPWSNSRLSPPGLLSVMRVRLVFHWAESLVAPEIVILGVWLFERLILLQILPISYII